MHGDRREQEHDGRSEQHLRERILVEKQSLDAEAGTDHPPHDEDERGREQKVERVVHAPQEKLPDRLAAADPQPPEQRREAHAQQQPKDVHRLTPAHEVGHDRRGVSTAAAGLYGRLEPAGVLGIVSVVRGSGDAVTQPIPSRHEIPRSIPAPARRAGR
jgi:hypothetical protein